MSKLGILLGAGVGYVLGTRAGRERYEQIRQQVQRVWKDPRVQDKKEQAADAAKQKGAELQDKASQKVAESSSDTSGDAGDTSSTTTSSTTTTPTATSPAAADPVTPIVPGQSNG